VVGLRAIERFWVVHNLDSRRLLMLALSLLRPYGSSTVVKLSKVLSGQAWHRESVRSSSGIEELSL